MTNTRDAPVFTAGEHCFTWVDVIEAASVHGDWAVLQGQVIGLLARERELAAESALPDAAQTRAAANDFRYQRKLLSADELKSWLARWDVSVDEWTGEMRRSLLEPADISSSASPDELERASWVHAVCSGKLAEYARTLAEGVAVHLIDGPLMLTPDELAALPAERERFCDAQLGETALADEINTNKVGWTRVELRVLQHRDEMVVREAALCVRQDGRDLADVAADARAHLDETKLVLDDVDPTLRTRLLAASPGEYIGPFASGADHQFVQMVEWVPPTVDDPAARRRAGEAIIGRALAGEVSRRVNWHEYL